MSKIVDDGLGASRSGAPRRRVGAWRRADAPRRGESQQARAGQESRAAQASRRSHLRRVRGRRCGLCQVLGRADDSDRSTYISDEKMKFNSLYAQTRRVASSLSALSSSSSAAAALSPWSSCLRARALRAVGLRRCRARPSPPAGSRPTSRAKRKGARASKQHRAEQKCSSRVFVVVRSESLMTATERYVRGTFNLRPADDRCALSGSNRMIVWI